MGLDERVKGRVVDWEIDCVDTAVMACVSSTELILTAFAGLATSNIDAISTGQASKTSLTKYIIHK